MKYAKELIKRTKRLLPFLILAICLAGYGTCLAGCGNSREAAEEVPEVKVEKIPLEEETAEDGRSTDGVPADEIPADQESGDGAGNGKDGSAASEEEPGKVPPAQVRDRPEGWTLTLASEDWGLSFGELGTAPTGNASAEDLLWYDAYFVGGGDEKVIYLTFDCGYENGNTAPILDALKKHNAPGAFFVVGHFLETAPDMVKRMVEE